MSMPTSEWLAGAGLLCLALSGCDREAGASKSISPGSDAGIADCSIGADTGWTRSCPVERDGDMVTFRHADGGFRRFQIVKDGRGLIAADGAEQASVAITGKGQIELIAGEDRYRLPATIAEAIKP